MKKIALIIGSPSHPNTPAAGKFLEGVKTDIANIIGFLSSSVGGSWTESEIKRFSVNPKYSEVEPYLKECEIADFAFIYFSGHGYTDSNGNPCVLFNNQDSVDVINDLAKRAKHQVTIIDACRSYPEFIGFDGEVFLESISFPNHNKEFTKDILTQYIVNLPNTRVLLCATSKGKSAMDYGVKFGGLFSTNLLSVVKDKLKSDKKAIFKIADVFEIAKIKTREIEPEQVPKIYYSDSNSEHLPFAINPYHNHLLIKKSQEVFKKNDTTLIEDIAKGALIGGGILLAGYLIGSLLSKKK